MVSKIDLLPHVDYEVARVRRLALAVNPQLRIFEPSVDTLEGLDHWYERPHAWACANTREGSNG